jgi:farnesyl-diphosphate farnesyltransferase
MDWRLYGVGEGDELILLENFYKCTSVFLSLPKASQDVIADITKRMGEGMALYVGKDLGQGTVTVADYDKYCHYVAGLVGEGLSRLFTCSGYETEAVGSVSKTLANTMGLFLQKTNIIRDYLEDYVDGRAFWPQEIWKQYLPDKTGGLGSFAEPANFGKSVQLLNHLVTNALECVPECLEYLSLLKTKEVFRFCAIPQVMAIATLHELYNNKNVFTGVVKIRKGTAASLILDSNDAVGVHKWFSHFAQGILAKVSSSDPNAAKTRDICQRILKLTAKESSVAKRFNFACSSTFMTFAFPLWLGLNDRTNCPTVSALALVGVYPVFMFISNQFRK